VVLKISSDAAGEFMASRSTVVRRGMSKPLAVLLTSSIAELSGALFVVLMAMPWAFV